MLSFYLGSFIFAAIIIGSSIILGHDDADGDVDHDLDHDASLDKDLSIHTEMDALGWMPLLSMRFWTFSLGCFGLSGTLLTMLGTGSLTTSVTSVVLGLILGYATAYLFQRLKNNSVTISTNGRNFVEQEAKVLLPIRVGKQGKIRVFFDNELTDLIACTQDNIDIEQGSTVLIVSIDNGVANVTNINPHTSNRHTLRDLPEKE